MVGTLYRDRLAKAMAEAKIGVAELAKELGVSYQAVRKVLTGGTKSMNAKNNTKAARFLKVDADWLATGTPPPPKPAAPAQQPANVITLQASVFEAETIQRLIELPPKWQGRAEEAVLRIIKEHSETRRKSTRH